MRNLTSRQKAVVILAVAAVVRLLYIAVAGRHTGIVSPSDAIAYDMFARMMLDGWQWVREPLTTAREPMYPFFMFLCYLMPGPDFGWLQIGQVILGSLAPVLLYLGTRRKLSESVALLAATFVVFNPHLIVCVSEPLRENLIVPLLIGFLVAFLRAVDSQRNIHNFWCAFFFTILVHTDVRFLPLAASLPVMIFVSHGRTSVAVKQTVWIWTFVLLLMVPYQIRASVAMGQPTIVTNRFLGRWLPRAASLLPETKTASGDKRARWLMDFEARKDSTLSELPASEREYFAAGGRPATAPGQVYLILLKEYWRFGRYSSMYRPYPDGRFVPPWSLRHNLMSTMVVLPFLIMLPFVFIGLESKAREVVYPLAVFLALHTLLHVFVHARERYRIPMEVVMGVLLAVALANAWSLWAGRRRSAHADQ